MGWKSIGSDVCITPSNLSACLRSSFRFLVRLWWSIQSKVKTLCDAAGLFEPVSKIRKSKLPLLFWALLTLKGCSVPIWPPSDAVFETPRCLETADTDFVQCSGKNHDLLKGRTEPSNERVAFGFGQHLRILGLSSPTKKPPFATSGHKSFTDPAAEPITQRTGDHVYLAVIGLRCGYQLPVGRVRASVGCVDFEKWKLSQV